MRKFFLIVFIAVGLFGSNAWAAAMSGSLAFTGSASGEMIAINAFQGNPFTWSIDYDASTQLWTYSYVFRPSGSNRGPSFFDIETAGDIGDLTTSFAYANAIPSADTLATLTPTSARFSGIIPIDNRINTGIAVAASNTHVPANDPLTGAKPYGYEAWIGSGSTALAVHVNSVMTGVQAAIPSRTYGMVNGPSQPDLLTGYNAGGTIYQVVMTTKSSPMWGRFYLDGGDWTTNNGWLMAYNREYDNPSRPAFVLGTNQGGWIAVPGDSTPPVVQATNPSDNATGIPVNAPITVAFSEDIDQSTINGTTFTVANVVNVPGAVGYDKVTRTATFTPLNSMSPGTTYTVSVSGGVKDLAGNAMTAARVWSFTTAATVESTPPAVLSTTPEEGATGIAVGSVLSAIFSQDLDPATVNATTFTVNGVSGTVSYDAASRRASFSPGTALSYATTYTASITGGIKSSTGQALGASKSWSFSTAAPPDLVPPTVTSLSPANGAKGVDVKGTLTVIFSETLNPGTMDAATFTLRDADGRTVDGSVAYLAATNRAIFTPSAPLSYFSTYTANLSAGIKDTAGNPLALQSWSFTTAALYGDLNGSGGIPTLEDGILALRVTVGLQTPTSYQLAACDVAPLVDGKPHPDGKVDGGDVIVLLRRVVGLDAW